MQQNYRRCISCRQVGTKEVFWRIVRVYPSGQLQLDRGMGRSAYLCPQQSCLKAAMKKNRLGKALRASVPQEIYQTLSKRLTAGRETSPQTELAVTIGVDISHKNPPENPVAYNNLPRP